ncbi:nex-1 [Pristionchus pacificus]|uniref:Nex-1 n=1 Tax=Pristionchus pacificus TaxID=54126 RepID=A0A2A6CHH4_PRIPA|nr:nex-1 [Pristionchus pacificus]|eukprot:PDM77546.1 nex-1 [Pristionchus pacificus]
MTSSYYPIHEKAGFDADAYAEKIERALRAGDKVKGPYLRRYGKELDAALDKKFSGDAELLILALMKTPLAYDLEQLENAMKGMGTDENTLIEIICSRTPDQLKAITAHYNKDPKHAKCPLEKAIAGDTSGEFKDLLVALVGGSKDGGHSTNDVQAKDDAIRLYADGKAKLKGGAGSHFLHILATQNMYQLRKVFAEFEKLSGTSIETAIKKEFSGDLEKAYLTIVGATVNKQKFFAEQLHASMKGFGTRENDLVRVIVARSEVDLNLIREEFLHADFNKGKKTLEDTIKGDTSGVFRDTLLAICAGNQ